MFFIIIFFILLPSRIYCCALLITGVSAVMEGTTKLRNCSAHL